MQAKRIMVMVALLAGSGLALHLAPAQEPGLRRTELQRHDLGATGREVVHWPAWYADRSALGERQLFEAPRR